MFLVELEGFDPVNLIIMKNLSKNVDKSCIKFDLKGSTKNRRVLENNEEYDYSTTLKDVDLMKMLFKNPSLITLD